MKQDTTTTIVKFKKEKNGSILAIFPEVIETTEGCVMCYAHVGQHSAAAPAYFKSLKKATHAEYADLKAELESIGYNLIVK